MIRLPRFPPLPPAARIAACAACLTILPAAASAQFPVGRLFGSVRDIAGRPIGGASVHAVNPSAVPSAFSATVNKKGEWSILGPRSGVWKVSAEAPGFEPATVSVPVSLAQRAEPIDFVLVALPARSPLDGVDTKRLQDDLSRASALMAGARWDEAVAAYRAILARVPLLDSVNFAIGRALRMKKDYAGAEAAYRALLERDARNQQALLEVGRTQIEAGNGAAAAATLDGLLAIDASTEEAAEARELLARIRK